MLYFPNKSIGLTNKICALFNSLNDLIPEEFISEIDKQECVFKFEYTKDTEHPTLLGSLTIYRTHKEKNLLQKIETFNDFACDGILWFNTSEEDDYRYKLYVSDKETDHHFASINISEPLIIVDLHDEYKHLYI